MTENHKYNATDSQVKPPKVDERYVADLKDRIRAARRVYQEASARLEVLSETNRQARAR